MVSRVIRIMCDSIKTTTEMEKKNNRITWKQGKNERFMLKKKCSHADGVSVRVNKKRARIKNEMDVGTITRNFHDGDLDNDRYSIFWRFRFRWRDVKNIKHLLYMLIHRYIDGHYE